MQSLPRHYRKKVKDKSKAPESPGGGEDQMKAAEHQAAIQVAAAGDMPLPESYFYPIYFSKQVFDDAYRLAGVKPTYVGRERYIRPSDLRKIITARAKDALSTSSVSNLPKTPQ